MKTLILLSSAVFMLTACDGANLSPSDGAGYAPEAVMMDMAEQKSSRSQPSTPQVENPSDLSFMAYRYNYGYTLPAKNVAPTAKSHAEICLTAGPSRCQVLYSSTNSQGEDYVTAQLQIRGEPIWLETFKDQVQASVKDADGKLSNSSVNAEDLTGQILDTDARLKAKKTLRTRLENHLETRDAKLDDLLALERELARVQGEIESATSTLAVLRKRVSMSVVDINYQSKSVAVSRNAFSPVVRAVKDFMGDISQGLAGVIRFFAAILPWLVFVILPGLWLIRRFWRGRKLRLPARKNKDDA